MHATADFRQQKHELEAILSSGIFNRAPNLELLLKYVCAKYFEGTGDQIKEYNIAVEALGRPADFDQKRDSIVRVEAHRLRKRLRDYYDTDGAEHALRIDIPPGQYAPRFVPAELPPPNGTPASPASPEDPAVECLDAIKAEPDSEAALIPSPAELVIPAVASGATNYVRTPVIIAALLLITIAAAAGFWRSPKKSAVNTTAGQQPIVAGIRNSGELRILAGHEGGDYTDRAGRVWLSDRYFQGGSVFEAHDHPVFGTREPRIYQSRREGSFSYDIPLPAGVYELRLHFAETLYGENNMAGGGEASRVFRVSINGREALHEFDVISEVGPSTADIRVFKDVSAAADGKLHLKFEANSNPPMLSAIEITPGIPGKLRPIRMVSLDRAYVDKQGLIWEPDGYARGGQLVARSGPVSGGIDPELFRGERFGNLRYVVPVPPGRYGVTFYFAEAWFGPETPAGGGVGSRVFDILCNGVALRRGFDVFKEAHGGGRGISWTAHGLEPDAQGKLNIALSPVHNYASVNAIEVVDEAK